MGLITSFTSHLLAFYSEGEDEDDGESENGKTQNHSTQVNDFSRVNEWASKAL